MDSETDLSSEDQQYLTPDGNSIFAWVVAGIGIAAEIVLVLFFVALVRGRRDKQVKAVGFSFIGLVLLGAMCGQGFLILQVRHIKVVETPTWLGCAFQTWLLLLHLHLLNAPLLAKFCAVLKRIRDADTQRLLLWDAAARQQTVAQLLLAVALLCAHLGVTSQQREFDFGGEVTGGGCVEGGSSLQESERGFYAAQTLLLVVLVLPSPIIYVLVTGSSFAPLFPEWNVLCQSVQALLFAAALTGTTFFVDQVRVQQQQQQQQQWVAAVCSVAHTGARFLSSESSQMDSLMPAHMHVHVHVHTGSAVAQVAVIMHMHMHMHMRRSP